jgi:tetratricopeptide (TPR) repeat protein
MNATRRNRIVFLLSALLIAVVGIICVRYLLAYGRDRYAQYYLLRGYEYFQDGQYDDAIRYYTKSIKISPQNAVSYYDRGAAYFAEKEFDKAIGDFTVDIRLEPTNLDSFQYRGLAYGMKPDLSNAIADFTRAIELRPNDSVSYYRRGFAYALGHHWADAISNYMAAVHIEPSNAAFYQGIGYAYFQMREPSKAIENYENAIQLAPDDPSTLNSLAWLLSVYPDARIRDGQKAVGLAQRACEISNWDKWYCIGTLAAAYAEIGDFTNAVKYQKEAMLLNGPTEREN